MSEIPEDVIEAAKRAVSDFPYDSIDPLQAKAAVVARAIMAERERCAAVARFHPDSAIGKIVSERILSGEQP